MTLVNPTQITDGSTATAASVNNPINALAAAINGNLDATNLADGAVTQSKIASTVSFDWIPSTIAAPSTITYNGNRNYSLVFNTVDYTSKLSPGMKLKLGRTITAPIQCTSLNGTNQSFSRASASLTGIAFTTTFSAMAWIKPSAYQQGGIITRWNGTNGWLFYLNASGQVNVQSGTGAAAVTYQSIPLNKWTHIAASYSSGTVVIYIDGVVAASTGSPTATVTQAGNLEVGSMNGASFFAGKIAQTAVFSAVISQATIQSYISQGLGGAETSLISAYSFNNSVNDLNANANTLTANGSAVATNADSPFAGGVTAPYTAGTTEFGEVFNVNFSTNTTVVVQVPDGYAIPTIGGVSAVSYSSASTPLGWPLNGGVTNLARAINGLDFTTVSVTPVLVSGMSVPVYVPVGRSVRVAWCGDMRNQSTGGGQLLALYIGATLGALTNRITMTQSGLSSTTDVHFPGVVSGVFTPPSSGTWYLSLATAIVSTGTAVISGMTAYPNALIVDLF